MRELVSEKVKGLAKLLDADKQDTTPTPGLSDQEQRTLLSKGTGLLEKVKKNISQKTDPYDGMPLEDKLKLMAYVVYKRQNVGGGQTTNDEDAAKVLKSTLYREDNKQLEKDLTKQLTKAFGLKPE